MLLNAAEKGFERLTGAIALLESVPVADASSFQSFLCAFKGFYDAMNDDFNAPILVANLFDAVKKINLIKDNKETINAGDKDFLLSEMKCFVHDVLGLEFNSEAGDDRLSPVNGFGSRVKTKKQELNKDWGHL